MASELAATNGPEYTASAISNANPKRLLNKVAFLIFFSYPDMFNINPTEPVATLNA